MSALKTSEYLPIFFELRDMSDGTRQIYDRAFDRLIDALGDNPVEQIGTLDAQRFHHRLRTSKVRGAPVSTTTVNMYTRAVKSFFNWLADAEAIEKSPFRGIKMLRQERTGHVPYEDVEIGAMLAAAPNDRWRMIVALAVTTGLRRGEILNLSVGEIDYLAGVITVRSKSDTARTWAWTIKDHESRTVPITGLLESLMLRQQATLPDGQPYLCLTPDRYNYLIRKKNRYGLSYDLRKCPESNFLRTFKQICRRAKVTYRSFHAIRGTCLSVMAENGLQPHELMEIAGHSSVRTTYQHYVRPRSQMLMKARSAAFTMGAEGLEPPAPCL